MKPCLQQEQQSAQQGLMSSPMSPSCPFTSGTKEEGHTTTKLRVQSSQFEPGEQCYKSTNNIAAPRGGWLNEAQECDFESYIEEFSKELSIAKTDEKLDYLFVIDFECNQPGSEIIEFPIIVVDLQKKEIIDSFHSFVRPTVHPQLSKFIKNLTGIAQKDVEVAEELYYVLRKAEKFLAKYSSFPSAILYDCDNDAKFLRDELKAKDLQIKQLFLMSYINLRNVFPLASTGGLKNKSLCHALEVLDLEFKGKKHSGKDDATNIARACIGLITKVPSFSFSSFMLQSQFYPDIPRKYVQDSLSSLFQHSTHVISIHMEFETQAPAKSNIEIQHCKYFKLVLFSRELSASQGQSHSTSFKESNTTPNKGKEKEQELLTQTNLSNPNSVKDTTTSSDPSTPPSKLLLQQSELNKVIFSAEKPTLDPSDLRQVALIDKKFLDESRLCDAYFQLLQEIIQLYTDHNVKRTNSLVILAGQAKQASMKKFLKDFAQLFSADKNLFVFKYKMLFLPEILDKLQITQEVAQDINTQEFPQAIHSLIEIFRSAQYTIQDKPAKNSTPHQSSSSSTATSTSKSTSPPFSKLFQSCLPSALYSQPQQLHPQPFDAGDAPTILQAGIAPPEILAEQQLIAQQTQPSSQVAQSNPSLYQRKLLAAAKRSSPQDLGFLQQQQQLMLQQQQNQNTYTQMSNPMTGSFEGLPFYPFVPSEQFVSFQNSMFYNTMACSQNEAELQKVHMQLHQLSLQIEGLLGSNQNTLLDQLQQQYKGLIQVQQSLQQQSIHLQMQQQQQQHQIQQVQHQQQFQQIWLQQQQQNNYFFQQRQQQTFGGQEQQLLEEIQQQSNQSNFKGSKGGYNGRNNNNGNNTSHNHKKKQQYNGNGSNQTNNQTKQQQQKTTKNGNAIDNSNDSFSSTGIQKAHLSPTSMPFLQADRTVVTAAASSTSNVNNASSNQKGKNKSNYNNKDNNNNNSSNSNRNQGEYSSYNGQAKFYRK